MAAVFGELQALRERPLPAKSNPFLGEPSYRAILIDAGGVANSEPLVEAARYGLAGENFYAQDRKPPYYHRVPGAIDQLLLRQGVAERLRSVDARLKARDLELYLLDGWRPRAVQIYFHDEWLPRELRRRDPSLAGAALTAAVERYWAAPTQGPGAPAPHATGGAVDLTIRWRGGEALWMGSLFDDAAAISNTDHFEDAGADPCFSNEEARANRRLLYWLMAEAGLASNPSEWWHFSHGDQMWARLTGAAQALYGAAEPDYQAPACR